MRSDLLRVLICGAALALAGQAVAEGRLKGVETKSVAGATTLQIIGNGLKKPTIVKGDGHSTIFTFNAYLPGKGKEVAWGKDGLKSFRYYWFKTRPRHLVRVQVWPENGQTQPTVTKNADGWLVTWTGGPAKAGISSLQAGESQPPKTGSVKSSIPQAEKADGPVLALGDQLKEKTSNPKSSHKAAKATKSNPKVVKTAVAVSDIQDGSSQTPKTGSVKSSIPQAEKTDGLVLALGDQLKEKTSNPKSSHKAAKTTKSNPKLLKTAIALSRPQARPAQPAQSKDGAPLSETKKTDLKSVNPAATTKKKTAKAAKAKAKVSKKTIAITHPEDKPAKLGATESAISLYETKKTVAESVNRATPKVEKAKPAPAIKPSKARIKAVATKASWVGNTNGVPASDSLKSDTKTGTGSPKAKPRKVSLDFVNTDIVQILKALAMQSNVNIVTSPEVKGNLTVSLSDVTVDEALDLVTTLTGLAYDTTRNTYIVAGRDKIVAMKRSIERTTPSVVVSNVVPIYSGEGAQIKAALLRTIPADTIDGSFELVLPSEETKVEKTTEDKQGSANGNTGGNSGDENKTKVQSTATTASKDLYVVVMGSTTRVNEVSRMVSQLDMQFCKTMGITIPTSTALVTKSYQVRGGSAQELAAALAPKDGKVGNVAISATPAASKSDQAIVLNGRENEVNAVLMTLGSLDSTDQIGDEFFMYDVKFADPRSLRESVVSQVPGLRASIPPASAGNPRLYQPGESKAMASEMTKEDPSKNGGSGSVGSAGSDPKPAKENGKVTEGLASPFTEMERAGVPMKLLMRGTPEQLRSAQAYLRMVDVAPKQIALELRVMELSKEDALRIGIDWNIFTGGAVSLIRFNQSLPTPGSNSTSVRISGDNWGANITATLDNTIDRQRLIARPNLFAIDGRESEIFVGDIVRYVSSKSTNPTTGELQISIAEVPVGVRLAVLPRIGADGSITMDLRPVVSSITGFLNAGNGIQIPQTSSRIAQSTVNIMSGETIAIGGLIQDTDMRNVSKVPILGDLPIIGVLFRRTDNSRARREVVFFLTAREVSAQDRQNAADPRVSEGRNPAEMGQLKKSGGG